MLRATAAKFTGIRPRLSHRFSIGSNTFYDSQSGGFITRPGSQGIRIHDSLLKCTEMRSPADSATASKVIVDYMRDSSRRDSVKSVTLPIIASDELFKQYMNASVPYLIRNQSQISIKVASQPQNLNQIQFVSDLVSSNSQAIHVLESEIDIIASKSSNLKDTSTDLVTSLPQLSTKGLVTRVNVCISIDPFVNKNEAELLSVIEMGEVFAKLCDVGVKVINICLCSNENQSEPLDPSTAENILDYLREIIEEGLNLDVSGDALLERLSVQCTSENVLPGLVELVKGLGITRFTTSGTNSARSGISTSKLDGLIDNKGKVMMRSEKGTFVPFIFLPSMDAITFAEKYL